MPDESEFLEGAIVGGVLGGALRRNQKRRDRLPGPDFRFVYVGGHPRFPRSDSSLATHLIVSAPECLQYTRGDDRSVTFEIPLSDVEDVRPHRKDLMVRGEGFQVEFISAGATPRKDIARFIDAIGKSRADEEEIKRQFKLAELNDRLRFFSRWMHPGRRRMGPWSWGTECACDRCTQAREAR